MFHKDKQQMLDLSVIKNSVSDMLENHVGENISQKANVSDIFASQITVFRCTFNLLETP